MEISKEGIIESIEGPISELKEHRKLKECAPDKINQEQFYELLMNKNLSWHSLIYDLIYTEQLDPWDIDITILAARYLERIKELEEESFFVSSKILLVSTILLRIKSELILTRYIRSIDEILFGRKEQKKYVMERIEIDGVPELIPKTPLPRMKKITLNELLSALETAMNTESRRIRKEIEVKQRIRNTEMILPKVDRIHIRERISQIYAKILELFGKKQEKISFTELAGNERASRISTFVPLLHMHGQNRIFLEQEGHFTEIYVWLKKVFDKLKRAEYEEKIRKEIGTYTEEEIIEQKEQTEKIMEEVEKINEDFENPLGDFLDITPPD